VVFSRAIWNALLALMLIPSFRTDPFRHPVVRGAGLGRERENTTDGVDRNDDNADCHCDDIMVSADSISQEEEIRAGFLNHVTEKQRG
jgi:hypothetical protein